VPVEHDSFPRWWITSFGRGGAPLNTGLFALRACPFAVVVSPSRQDCPLSLFPQSSEEWMVSRGPSSIRLLPCAMLFPVFRSGRPSFSSTPPLLRLSDGFPWHRLRFLSLVPIFLKCREGQGAPGRTLLSFFLPLSPSPPVHLTAPTSRDCERKGGFKVGKKSLPFQLHDRSFSPYERNALVGPFAVPASLLFFSG